MAKSLNTVQLIGYLGNDPEMRYMPNGDAVTNMSIATSEQWIDKNTGQPQERTDWHRVTCFRGNAETAGKYLRKGSRAFLEGAIRYDSWQDETTGETKYATKIVAHNIILLDKKQTGDMHYPEAQQGQTQGHSTSAPINQGGVNTAPVPNTTPPAPVGQGSPKTAPVNGNKSTPAPVPNTPPVAPESAQNASGQQGQQTAPVETKELDKACKKLSSHDFHGSVTIGVPK